MEIPPTTRKQHLAHRVIAPQVAYGIRFELAMLPVRLRGRANRRMHRGRTALRVNVGAGTNGRDGWVNIDAFRGSGITCIHDCRWNLPFDDGSVELLFAEHFLEHLEPTVEVPRFLAEVRRVLAPGGRLRVVVPDVELYLRAYCAGDWESLRRIRPLSGRRDRWFPVEYETPLELAQFVMRQFPAEPHQYGYDADTLSVVLAKAGLHSVERLPYAESRHPELALDHPERASESLYVEAVRSSGQTT